MAEKLSDSAVDLIEMNISCPNVKQGGVQFGHLLPVGGGDHQSRPPALQKAAGGQTLAQCGGHRRNRRRRRGRGADALSMINTLTGMRIDIHTRRPILRNNTGGCPARPSCPSPCGWCGRRTSGCASPSSAWGGSAAGRMPSS